MNNRDSPRGLRLPALVFACVFTFAGWSFVTGEAMSDPGRWKGLGLTASWTVPLLGLAILAWYRPGPAASVLTALTAAMIAVTSWFALDPGGWRSFENGHGPVRAIGVLVLMLPLALLGWRRPRRAGWSLLALGLAPVLMASIGGRQGSPSTMAVAVPALVDGVLWLLAAGRPSWSGAPAARLDSPGWRRRPWLDPDRAPTGAAAGLSGSWAAPPSGSAASWASPSASIPCGWSSLD